MIRGPSPAPLSRGGGAQPLKLVTPRIQRAWGWGQEPSAERTANRCRGGRDPGCTPLTPTRQRRSRRSRAAAYDSRITLIAVSHLRQDTALHAARGTAGPQQNAAYTPKNKRCLAAQNVANRPRRKQNMVQSTRRRVLAFQRLPRPRDREPPRGNQKGRSCYLAPTFALLSTAHSCGRANKHSFRALVVRSAASPRDQFSVPGMFFHME